MTSLPPPVPATSPGWYADPWGQAPLRYWDGWRWTPLLGPPTWPEAAHVHRATAPRRTRRRVVVTAIVLSLLLAAGGGTLAVAALSGGIPGLQRGTTVGEAQLQVGNCLELPKVVSARPSGFVQRDCQHSHNGEVFARASLPSGEYPGEVVVRQEVADACEQGLPAFLGSGKSTTLHVIYLYPTADTWAIDHDYVCIVVNREHDVTGTMRGSGAGPLIT